MAITWSWASYRGCCLALCLDVGPSPKFDKFGRFGEHLAVRLADHDDEMMLEFLQLVDELKYVGKYAAIDDYGRRRMQFEHL